MQNKLEVGDSVQSHYRSRWYGRVVGIETGKYNWHGKMHHYRWARVIMLLDKCGNIQRKTKVVRYDESWFSKVDFDVTEAYLDKKMEKYN